MRPACARTTARGPRPSCTPLRWAAWLLRAQDVDVAEQGRRAAVAHRVRLARLALAVVREAHVLPVTLVGDRGAGAPEIVRATLIGHVRQHAALLAVLDLPERVAAELEVVALLVDRVRAAAVDQDAVLDLADEIVEARAVGARLEPHVRHALERDAVEAVGVAAAARLLLADEVRLVSDRLVGLEHAALDDVPARRLH